MANSRKKPLTERLEERFDAIWKDPVWSKVIATIIVGIGVFFVDRIGEYFGDKETKTEYYEDRNVGEKSEPVTSQMADTVTNGTTEKTRSDTGNVVGSYVPTTGRKIDTLTRGRLEKSSSKDDGLGDVDGSESTVKRRVGAKVVRINRKTDFLLNSVPDNGFSDSKNIFLPDNLDTREIKLLPVSIINYRPYWWKILFGWMMLLFWYIILFLGAFSSEENQTELIVIRATFGISYLRKVIFFGVILFILPIGFVLSFCTNYAIMYFFKWIPSTYAIYKYESFFNWILGWL